MAKEGALTTVLHLTEKVNCIQTVADLHIGKEGQVVVTESKGEGGYKRCSVLSGRGIDPFFFYFSPVSASIGTLAIFRNRFLKDSLKIKNSSNFNK